MGRKQTRIPGVTVWQRGKAWRVQVRMGRDSATGRWLFKAETWDTEAEAWEAGRRLLAQRDAREAEHVEPTRVKLADYLGEWLRRKAAEGRKARTMYDYERAVRSLIIPALGDVRLQDLSPAMVQKWQDGLAARPDAKGATTAAQAYRALRSALSDATRLGLTAYNPASRARPAMRTPRKRPGFTLAEADAIIAAAEGERLAPLFAFILHTGLRHGEALGLQWGDIGPADETLTVRRNLVEVGGAMVEGAPKTERGKRTFALPAGARDALRRQRAQQAKDRLAAGEAWRAHEGWVFAARTGGPLEMHNVDRAFRRVRGRAAFDASLLGALASAGTAGAGLAALTRSVGGTEADSAAALARLVGRGHAARCSEGLWRATPAGAAAAHSVRPLPLYSLRHATASILLGAGVPVAVAAKMLGHSVTLFTETYADLLVEATRGAAAQVDAFWADRSKPPAPSLVDGGAPGARPLRLRRRAR